jgi:hypothetical protein
VDLSKLVESALDEGESVLWTGRPSSLAYVFGGLVVTAPLGLIAVGSALSWTRGERIAALPLWAQALLVLVLVFAVHMLILRPLLGLHIARRTAYAITDRRALVVCDVLGGRVQELRHDQGELIAIRGPRDFGKIQFGRTASSSVDVLLFGRAAIPGFYGLADLDEPLVRLGELRQSTTTSPVSMNR